VSFRNNATAHLLQRCTITFAAPGERIERQTASRLDEADEARPASTGGGAAASRAALVSRPRRRSEERVEGASDEY